MISIALMIGIGVLSVCGSSTDGGRGNMRLQVRGALFIPREQFYRTLYEDVTPSLQFELTRGTEYFEGWLNIDWFSQNGASYPYFLPTKLRTASISVGIQLLREICWGWCGYCGLGPSYARVKIMNRSYCGSCSEKTKTVFGGLFKIGAFHQVARNLFIELFAEYRYLPAILPRCIDIGGFRAGIGFGVML